MGVYDRFLYYISYYLRDMGKRNPSNLRNILIVSWAILVMLLFYYMASAYNLELTGRAIITPEDIIETIPPVESGEGGNGGEFENQEGKIISSKNSEVSFISPSLNVKFIGDVSQISSGTSVEVKKPSLREEAVAGKLVKWDTEFNVEKDIVGELKFILEDAKYVGVRGPDSAEVSINTKNLGGFTQGLFSVGDNAVEIIVKNPLKGNYDVSFSTGHFSIVSEQVLKDGNTEVVVSNPTSNLYSAVSVFTKVQDIKDSEDVKVIGKNGNEPPVTHFDSNADGKTDVVKFIITLPPETEQIYSVVKVPSTGDIEVSEILDQVSVSEGFPIGLPEECRKNVVQEIGECSYKFETEKIMEGVPFIESVQEEVFTSEEPDCPPQTKLIKYCPLDKKIYLVDDSEDEVRSVVVKSIIDVQTNKNIATFRFDKETQKLDIIFNQ